MDNNDRFSEHISVAHRIVPRGIGKAVILGFDSNFDFENPSVGVSPVALIVDNTPREFAKVLPVVSMLFELKNIMSYVIALEIASHPTNLVDRTLLTGRDNARDLMEAMGLDPDTPTVPNAVLYLVNLGKNDRVFLLRNDADEQFTDLGTPGMDILEAYSQLAPGDLIRDTTERFVKTKLSDEDREAFLSKYTKMGYRAHINEAKEKIAEVVANERPRDAPLN